LDKEAKHWSPPLPSTFHRQTQPCLKKSPCHHQWGQSVSRPQVSLGIHWSHNIINVEVQRMYNTHILDRVHMFFAMPQFMTSKAISTFQYAKYYLPVLGLEWKRSGVFVWNCLIASAMLINFGLLFLVVSVSFIFWVQSSSWCRLCP